MNDMDDYHLEIQWKAEWFGRYHKGYWLDHLNRRNFLEKVRKEHHISQPSDWGKMTIAALKSKRGGSGILKPFGYSIVRLLGEVYPGVYGSNSTTRIE